VACSFAGDLVHGVGGNNQKNQLRRTARIGAAATKYSWRPPPVRLVLERFISEKVHAVEYEVFAEWKPAELVLVLSG